MSIDAPPRELRATLLDALALPARAAVGALIAHCAQIGIPAYAAGGAVRDLLIDRPIRDVDLAVEGDAIDVVRTALPEARVTAHARFRTATVIAEGTRIDVVSARSEAYARPGALPRVTPATIVDDMRRRDFSVNAIALRLDGEPAIIDPCSGRDDLRARRIRVLHDGSFRDDATRIFRAFRYAARLGFDIEPHTRTLVDDGVRYIATIGGERLRREIELLLGDDPPGAALAPCASAGALVAIQRSLHWDAQSSIAFAHEGLRALLRGAEIVPFGFALLAKDASPPDADAIAARLRLKRAEAAAVRGVAALRGHRATLERPQAKPSGVALLLDRYPAASIAAFVADNTVSIAGEIALQYLREWRLVKPLLSGLDLQAMGVPEGPQVARGLQLIRAAKLDGWATDRDDERALALRFAKSIHDSGTMNASIDLDLDGD
jgi:tRNA nucleotidyltransferase (CCA-adding enzyme)